MNTKNFLIYLLFLMTSIIWALDTTSAIQIDKSVAEINAQFSKEIQGKAVVDAKGGLRIRKEPSIKSDVIGSIPDKTYLEVENDFGNWHSNLTGYTAEIKRNRGWSNEKLDDKIYFTKIKYLGKTGFVASDYLVYLVKKQISPDKKHYFELTGYQNKCMFSIQAEVSGLSCELKIFDINNQLKLKYDAPTALEIKKAGNYPTCLAFKWCPDIIGWLDNDNLLSRQGFGDDGSYSRNYYYINIHEKLTGNYYSDSGWAHVKSIPTKICLRQECYIFNLVTTERGFPTGKIISISKSAKNNPKKIATLIEFKKKPTFYGSKNIHAVEFFLDGIKHQIDPQTDKLIKAK